MSVINSMLCFLGTGKSRRHDAIPNLIEFFFSNFVTIHKIITIIAPTGGITLGK